MKIVLLLFVGCFALAQAQDPVPAVIDPTVRVVPPPPLPQAPVVQPAVKGKDAHEEYLYRIGYVCGVGATTSEVASKPTVGCGVGMTFVPLPLFVELGVMGPQANRSYLSGYVSVDYNQPLWSTDRYGVQALFGYSRLFETGHAVDYGLAVGLPRRGKNSPWDTLRIELRDYWTFANPTQHNVMLRLGWMSVESD